MSYEFSISDLTKSTPISIGQAFDSIQFLADRTPEASGNDDGFCTLGDYRDCAIFLAHYAGNSEWERHTNGDEIANFMPQGTLLVVPQNIWHRFESPKGVKVMTITPQPTDHSIERPE